jgi:uncharacterized lipoprotein YddW (UPF0748 family)
VSVTGVVRSLTAEQQAAEPRSLELVAWFDGYARKAYPLKKPATYPRPLLPHEAESWRQGYREAVAQAAEWERQQHLLDPICCDLCARSHPACPLCGAAP